MTTPYYTALNNVRKAEEILGTVSSDVIEEQYSRLMLAQINHAQECLARAYEAVHGQLKEQEPQEIFVYRESTITNEPKELECNTLLSQ